MLTFSQTHNIEFSTYKLIALDVLRGLRFLQKHCVVHFDVKPENILVDLEPGDAGVVRRAVVCDFGLARVFHPLTDFPIGYVRVAVLWLIQRSFVLAVIHA